MMSIRDLYDKQDYQDAIIAINNLPEHLRDNAAILEMHSHMLYMRADRMDCVCWQESIKTLTRKPPCAFLVTITVPSGSMTCTPLFQFIIDPHHTQPRALHHAGHEHIELSQPKQAVSAFLNALSIHEDYRALYGIGQIYELLEAFERAIDYYKRAARMRNGDWRMWAAIGRCGERMGWWEQSIVYYKYALEIAKSTKVKDSVRGDDRKRL